MDWEALSKALEDAYGNPRHGNPEEPVDCLFYLMLSRKTPIPVAGRVLGRLRDLVGGDWNQLPDRDEKEIAAAIYGSGLEEIRAGHIRKVAAILREQFGYVTLDPLREWSDEECQRFLTRLPGVGVKTALCAMMYTLDRQVFPADAHCIRILKRIGVLPQHLEHRPAQQSLSRLVPPVLAYKLHVNLVAHGLNVCQAKRVVCCSCAVRQPCQQGTMVGRGPDESNVNTHADNPMNHGT